MKEQLSTSTQKIELPNKKLVGVKPTEKKEEVLPNGGKRACVKKENASALLHNAGHKRAR